MKRKILAGAVGLFISSAAGAETVTQISAAPVAGAWYRTEVAGGGTADITADYPRNGNGSAYFTTSSSASKATLQYYYGALGTSGTELSTLSSVSYDFLRAASSTVDAGLAPVLRFVITKDNSFAGSLVFENKYQAQADAPTNWTTLQGSLDSGTFWATNSKLGVTNAMEGGKLKLSEWIANNAGSTLRVVAVNIGVGSGFANGTFAGAVDNVDVSFTGGQRVNANFELAAPGAVPEPATWAMMLVGFGMVGATARYRRRGTKVTHA